MATYSAAALDRYFTTLDNVRQAAAKELAEYLTNWLKTEEHDVGKFLEYAKMAFAFVLMKYGLVADEAACQFFEAAISIAVTDVYAERGVQINQEQIDKLVSRLGATHIERLDDWQGFVEQMGDRMGDYVKQVSHKSIARNVKRYADKGVRFARVLRGETNCTFCVTLASRGFVYKSEDSAEAPTRSHHYCDCEIVPGIHGDTYIEGVNQQKLLNDYVVFTEIDSMQRRRGSDEGLSQDECLRLKEAFFTAEPEVRAALFQQYMGKEMPAE